MPLDASNFASCISRIAARGSIGQKEATDLLHELYNESEKIKAKGFDNPIARAAGELADTRQADAERAHTLQMVDADKRQALIDHGTNKGTTIKGAIPRLIYRLVWGPDNGPKENASTFGLWNTRNWMSAFMKEVGANKRALRRPDMLIPIEEQLYRLHAGQEVEPGTAGEVATAIYRIQETMRQALNRAIGFNAIKNADDLSYSMSHDPEMIRRGGRGQPATPEEADAYKAWRDFVINRLDQKTWDRVTTPEGMTEAQAREDFLRRTYEGLVSDVRKVFRGESGESSAGPYFEGTYNMARSMTHERTLFWKDGTAAGEYRARYGSDRTWGSILGNDMVTNGRRAGLMTYFGSNPAGNLALVMQRIKEMFRDKDLDGVTQFNKQAESYRLMNIEHLMASLDGTADLPANKMLAKVLNTAMQAENMSMLGNVSLTHLAGLAITTPLEARWSGIGTLTSLGKMMASMFPDTMPAEERAGGLAEIGAFGRGMASVMHDYFANGWSFPGMVSAMNHYFHEATGLGAIFNRAQGRGFSMMVAQNLANNIGKDFDKLEPHLQSTLMQYGLGPEQWQVLKTGELHKFSNGDRIMTPAIAKSVSDSSITDMLRARGDITAKSTAAQIAQRVAGARQDIADRLGMYYTDTAQHGIVTPDAASREQIAHLLGNKPITRAFMQFKSWPVAFLTQKIMQVYQQSNSLGDKLSAYGTMLTIGIIAGYLRMTAGDLAAGREPRTPQTVGDAARIGLGAIVQSGGFGIFGDMLFGEINRMGVSGAVAAGGPLVTDATKLGGLFNDFLKGEPTALPQLARWGMDHVPGSNLFYVKDLLDYGLLFHAYEWMHPGWWERTNRRMEKEQGRHMLFYGSYQP